MTNTPLNIDQICDVLDIKTTTKRILLLLIEKNNLSVTDISSELKIPKSSIYDSLNELVDKSIVIEYMEGRSKTFGISDLSQLEFVYKKRLIVWNQLINHSFYIFKKIYIKKMKKLDYLVRGSSSTMV